MRTPLFTLVLSLAAACAAQRFQVESQADPSGPATEAECPIVALSEGRAPAVPADQRVPLVAPEVAAVIIHGRVSDLRGEALPAGGLHVRLTIGERRIEGRTDDFGEFRFALQERPEHATIWVNPPDELRWVDDSQPFAAQLTAAQLDGTAPLELHVARRIRGPVHGIVVDAETGDPLPAYRFTLSPGYKSTRTDFETVELVTDAEGRFRTETEVFGGRVYARAPRGEPQPQGGAFDCIVQTETYDEPAILRVSSGPTYELRLVGDVPFDVTQLYACLVQDYGTANATTALRVDPVTGRTWVRLPAHRWSDSTPCFLAVFDEPGLITGTARVPLNPKAPTDPVSIVMEPTAALKPAFFWPRSAASLAAGESCLHPIGSVRRLETVDHSSADATTAWRLARWKNLRPGDYRMLAWSREHEAHSSLVSLAAGEFAHPELELKLLSDLRTVRGEIRVSDGSPVPSAKLFLRWIGSEHREWIVHYNREPTFCGTGIEYSAEEVEGSAGSVLRFEIEGVPPGELEVFGECSSGEMVPAVTWRAGEGGDVDLQVEFSPAGSGPGFGFHLDWTGSGRDSSTASALMVVHSRQLGDSEEFAKRFSRGGVFDRRNPTNLNQVWAACANGCRPVYFTAADFVDEGAGRWMAPLRFEPGFGLRLHVVDGEGNALAGAAVIADGIRLGNTDATGWFEVSTEELPSDLRVEYGALAWQLPATGWQYTEYEAWREVVLSNGGKRASDR